MHLGIKKNETVLMVIVAAILTAVLSACCLTALPAKAEAEDEITSRVYLITDIADSRFYGYINLAAQNIASEDPSFAATAELLDWSDNFYDRLVSAVDNDSLNYLQNSYVVVEVGRHFPVRVLGYDNKEDYEVFKLELFLRYLKQDKNCKVMLLLGEDETFLAQCGGDYTAFLDLVDIHIKINSFKPFLHNFIGSVYRQTNFDDGNIIPYDLFLDDSLSGAAMIKQYIRPSIRNRYEIEYTNNGYPDMDEGSVLYNIGIKIHIMETEDNFGILGYYPLKSNDGEPEFPDAVELNSYIYALSTNMLSEASILDGWLTSIGDYATASAIEINGDLYAGYRKLTQDTKDILADYEAMNIIERFDALGDRNRWFPYVIYDFIRNNDLSRYNNWAGRCNITYWPVNATVDGEIEGSTDGGVGEITNDGGDDGYGWYPPDHDFNDSSSGREINPLAWGMPYIDSSTTNFLYGN